MNVYQQVFLPKNKSFAVLIDPDKVTPNQAKALIEQVNSINEISALLVGGSLVGDDSTEKLIQFIKTVCHKPIILFPGNVNQVCKADAILFLSLISGRNPEYLIGQHVIGAPLIKNLGMEAIATGYMLVGESSSTSYVSNTTPLPATKPDLAQATAIAGEMLGNALIYMDAGSGAHKPISEEIIKAVAQAISVPLIVGGGIRSYEDAKKALIAGGHCVVIGNAAESNSAILYEIASAVSDVNQALVLN